MSVFLFFFKQKTAYDMRISDWSSDVCSSDLAGRARREIGMRRMPLDNDDEPGPVTDNEISSFFASLDLSYSDVTELATRWFLDRKSVVEGKSVSVSVELGGRRIIKKKKKDSMMGEQGYTETHRKSKK